MKNSTKRKLATGLIMVAGVAKVLSLAGCDTSNNPTEITDPQPIDKNHKVSVEGINLTFNIPYIGLSNAKAPQYILHIASQLEEFIKHTSPGYINAVNYLITVGNAFTIEIDHDSDTAGLLWDKTKNKFVVSKKWLEKVDGQNSPSFGDLRDLFNSVTAVRNANELLMALDVSSQNIRGA